MSINKEARELSENLLSCCRFKLLRQMWPFAQKQFVIMAQSVAAPNRLTSKGLYSNLTHKHETSVFKHVERAETGWSCVFTEDRVVRFFCWTTRRRASCLYGWLRGWSFMTPMGKCWLEGGLWGKECCSSWAITILGVNLMCNLDISHLQANCFLHTQNDLFVDKEKGGKVATGFGLGIRPNIKYWRKT